MTMQATSKEIEVHNLTIRNTAGDFTLNVEVTKVDRGGGGGGFYYHWIIPSTSL